MYGMNHEEIGLMRRLLRGLEFRLFAELVGQRFAARSPSELLASSELLELIGLDGILENDAMNLKKTMVGYGFIDLKFRLTNWPATLMQTGADVVRDLVGDPTSSRAATNDDLERERLGWLEHFCEEVDSGVRELTVMATALGLRSLPQRQRFLINIGREKPSFELFPREFEIIDAYITNAPTISLQRQLYL
ncbi:MAG: hypothetical protein AAGF12_21920 [Myxococcota bacterium]